MLLPPNNPNKKCKKNKNTSASTTPEKSISSKLVSWAKKLQETIDHLSSSDSLDESGNENVDDITSLNCERILSPQKTSSQILNIVQPQKSKKVRKLYNLNIQNFETIECLDDYMRTVCLKFKKTHNNDVNCSSCKLNQKIF